MPPSTPQAPRARQIFDLLRASVGPASPPSHARWTAHFYDMAAELFEVLTDESGIINFGYHEGPREPPPDLVRAQAELCRRTVASLPRQGRWLDVGSGVGGPATLLAAENPGVSITGININDQQIARANARAAALGLASRAAFRRGDACAIPPEIGADFDGVYAIETAFHYRDKAAFAREAARVLRRGGEFACADIVLRPKGFTLVDRVLLEPTRHLLAAPDVYTTPRWVDALLEAGFTHVEVEDITPQTVGLLAVWADQIEARRASLDKRYPLGLVSSVAWGMRSLAARVDDPPLRYVLLRARRAA